MRLVAAALSAHSLIAPSFAWAEIGSVLKKKVRQRLLTKRQADELWMSFCTIPIEYIDTVAVRAVAWEIAERYTLPTLYDAAFLACLEVLRRERGNEGAFWTTDRELLRAMGTNRPSFVRLLGHDDQ